MTYWRALRASVVPPLWTHEETAAYLRVNDLVLTYLVTAGVGPTCYWVGRHRRYDHADVLTWLAAAATGCRRHGRHVAPSRPGLTRTPAPGSAFPGSMS